MAVTVTVTPHTADASADAAPFKISRDPAHDDVTLEFTVAHDGADAGFPVVGWALGVSVPITGSPFPPLLDQNLTQYRQIAQRIQRASIYRRANGRDLASAGTWTLPDGTAQAAAFTAADLGSPADGDYTTGVFVLTDTRGWAPGLVGGSGGPS